MKLRYLYICVIAGAGDLKQTPGIKNFSCKTNILHLVEV